MILSLGSMNKKHESACRRRSRRRARGGGTRSLPRGRPAGSWTWQYPSKRVRKRTRPRRPPSNTQITSRGGSGSFARHVPIGRLRRTCRPRRQHPLGLRKRQGKGAFPNRRRGLFSIAGHQHVSTQASAVQHRKRPTCKVQTCGRALSFKCLEKRFSLP